MIKNNVQIIKNLTTFNIQKIIAVLTVICFFVVITNFWNSNNYWTHSVTFLLTYIIIILLSLYSLLIKKPLKSLVLLIFVFVLSAIILLVFCTQLVAINLIIIYLGAILVLLVFVIMLSNSNFTEIFELKGIYTWLMCFLAIKQITMFFFLFNSFYIESKKINLILFQYNANVINEISYVGHYLYNNQKLFLLSSILILLLALIVSLNLTKFTLQTNKFSIKKNGFTYKNACLFIRTTSGNIVLLIISGIIAAIIINLGFHFEDEFDVVGFYFFEICILISLYKHFEIKPPQYQKITDKLIISTIILGSVYCSAVGFENPHTFSWIFFTLLIYDYVLFCFLYRIKLKNKK